MLRTSKNHGESYARHPQERRELGRQVAVHLLICHHSGHSASDRMPTWNVSARSRWRAVGERDKVVVDAMVWQVAPELWTDDAGEALHVIWRRHNTCCGGQQRTSSSSREYCLMFSCASNGALRTSVTIASSPGGIAHVETWHLQAQALGNLLATTSRPSIRDGHLPFVQQQRSTTTTLRLTVTPPTNTNIPRSRRRGPDSARKSAATR